MCSDGLPQPSISGAIELTAGGAEPVTYQGSHRPAISTETDSVSGSAKAFTRAR